MYRDEADMLECRLTEMQDYDVTHVLVESHVTHLGIPKPLYYASESGGRFRKWQDRIRSVAVGKSAYRLAAVPWEREHVQRDMARLALAPRTEPDDLVLIADVDEIPSPAVLEWAGTEAAAVQMRTSLFAVDWEVPGCPPASVIARAGWLEGKSLAAVRDARGSYPVIEDGGWHLSWVGGPERQKEKLETASCHQPEIDARPEGAMIRDGTRYRTSQDGGGLAVIPIEVDETWPRYVYERRCPDNWFRPREDA
jgi:beta-1,4-mannosyl-glycoprotein beta-1,4-N-acetylglucosaminyltransferase